MTRVRLLFSEAVRSIGANLSTTAAAVVTVLIGMFLLGVFIGLGTWVVSWSDNVKKELVVKVYFTGNATKKQITAVGNRLERDPRVKSIAFIPKQEALRRMQKSYPQLTADLPANPLPDSFEIVPTKAENTEPVALSIQDAKLAGVGEVKYGKETSRQDPPDRAGDPGRLPDRGDHPARRVDDPDREYDPALDLRPPA